MHVELDRESAIGFAVDKARQNDVVLIAGKGHEAEQIVGSVRRPFSDQDTVRRLLGIGPSKQAEAPK